MSGPPAEAIEDGKRSGAGSTVPVSESLPSEQSGLKGRMVINLGRKRVRQPGGFPGHAAAGQGAAGCQAVVQPILHIPSHTGGEQIKNMPANLLQDKCMA